MVAHNQAHPAWAEQEAEAQRIFNRVQTLMGWRDEKVRWWMEHVNPLLGGISPVGMILHGRVARLDKFIDEAEELNRWTDTLRTL